jgi:YegS/Rv2252/BmrU family lipid kinase
MIERGALRVAVIFNPAARGRDNPGQGRRVRDALEAAGLEVTWLETSSDDPGTGLAKRALEEGADLICVSGGDGTVMACVTAVAGTDVPLAVLPAGTGNLLALNFGLPPGVEDSIGVAISGDRVRLDVCGLANRRFVVMGGIGFDAAMLRDTPLALKARAGAVAYLVGAARNLRLPPARLRLLLDGKREETSRAPCVLIGNVGKLQGGLEVLPRADPRDGLLDVGVIEAASIGDWIGLTAKLLRGVHEGDPRFRSFQAKAVEIWCDRPLPLELDGEVLEPVDHLRVEALPAALTLCVPRRT